jgi:hypothetical protein
MKVLPGSKLYELAKAQGKVPDAPAKAKRRTLARITADNATEPAGTLLGTLHCHYKLPSMNAMLTNKGRSQFSIRKKCKAIAELAVQPYLHLRFNGALRLRFITYRPRLNADTDGIITKYLTDALVRHKIIENDNAIHVRESGCRIERSADGTDRTQIEIYRDVIA